MTEDEMVGWHRRLGGHEFEQALGDGEGQGSLACCSPRGRKESYMTEQLNNRIHRLKNKQCVCACVCACTHTCKILKKKKSVILLIGKLCLKYLCVFWFRMELLNLKAMFNLY